MTPRDEANAALRRAIMRAMRAGLLPDAVGQWPRDAAPYFADGRFTRYEGEAPDTFRIAARDWWDAESYQRATGRTGPVLDPCPWG